MMHMSQWKSWGTKHIALVAYDGKKKELGRLVRP